jgi:tRNA U34 5-methylaminomethyl-2-thiouridine-forming methyltransferase MnmC
MLRERLAEPSPEASPEASIAPLRIWDVGLGAATNAVAALTAARSLGESQRRRLEIISFELTCEPLELALADPAGFPSLVPWQDAARALIADGVWSGPGLHWELRRGDFLTQYREAKAPAQLVYFDPFSPETNPSMWSPEALSALRSRAEDPMEGTLLITYSASTRTRVSMLQAGFFAGQGVAVGTRTETTVAATKLSLLKLPLGARWLQRWQRSDSRSAHGHSEIPDLLAHPQFARQTGL